MAKLCCVSHKTAQAWKAGTRKPSPAALELFQLRTTGQVIPEEFKGYYFAKGKLFPCGRLGFTPAQIEAYELVYKIATTFARPEVEAHLERMKLAMRESPPEAGTPHQSLPRWVWDPFFNPIEGERTILDGTHTDRRG